MASIKFLVVGIVLCFSITFAYGGLAHVTSLTSEVIERAFPAHLSAKYFGGGSQPSNNQGLRFKRKVVTKTFDDQGGCLTKCNKDEESGIVNAAITNAAKLVQAVLKVPGGDGETEAEKEAFKKKVEEVTIANLGPMFADFCTVSTTCESCLKKCPDSQIRSILLLQQADTSSVFCEPGDKKTWKDFSEYYTALNCTNNTVNAKPCDGKCGKELGVQNVTTIELSGPKKNQYFLDYENDSKKNTAAVGPACKNILCHNDCYKPIMTKNCGAKAADMYSRNEKMEPKTSLKILKLMNAVGPNSDCKEFQQ